MMLLPGISSHSNSIGNFLLIGGIKTIEIVNSIRHHQIETTYSNQTRV